MVAARLETSSLGPASMGAWSSGPVAVGGGVVAEAGVMAPAVLGVAAAKRTGWWKRASLPVTAPAERGRGSDPGTAEVRPLAPARGPAASDVPVTFE